MKIIESKICNALIKDAEADFFALFAVIDAFGLDAPRKSVEAAMWLSKKFMGGLWVGGNITLSDKSVVFSQNLMNRMIHKDDYSIEIPLNEVIDVVRNGGFFTGIIEIRTRKGTLSVRCYRANSFAARIKSALH